MKEYLVKRLQRKLNLRKAYRRLSKDPDFLLVLKHLSYESGITRPVLTSSSDDLLIREGSQRIVYSILRECIQSEDFILKQIEQVNEQPENEYDQ